ncbi:MAG: hypothetical protein SCL54_16365, partial [Bacillota bacterium]|nr:hypothetical protein [Bacillota bacterium]
CEVLNKTLLLNEAQDYETGISHFISYALGGESVQALNKTIIDQTLVQYIQTEASIESIITSIDMLGKNVDSITKVQNTVLETTGVVKTLSHKNAVMVDQLNSTSQEERSNIEEITSSIDNLYQLSEQLVVEIKRYKIL